MSTRICDRITLRFGGLDIACAERKPLTLDRAPQVCAFTVRFRDTEDRAQEICDVLRQCELQGSHEHLFLLLYFGRVADRLKYGASFNEILLPLPKVRFAMARRPSAVMADFAFWTGDRFVAVFILEDASDEKRLEQAALLKVWGFDVFCISATDFETQGLSASTSRRIMEAVGL